MLDNIILKIIKIKDWWTFWIKDKIFLFRELAYLIEWWVSILEAITLIKENTENMAIKEICDNLHENLKKWEPLHRSMSRLHNYFTDWDINIIRSWELSWELQNVLTYLATEYEFIYDIRNKYVWAVMYPTIVFVASLIAVYIIFRFVLPSIIWILDQFEWVQIPLTTRVLIAITDFVLNYTNHILIILGLLVFWLSILFSSDEWRKFFDYKIFRLPIIWRITKFYMLIKFLRYMRLLMNSWMNYVEIFQSLKFIMVNTAYKDMLDNLLASIRKWDTITDVFKLYPIIIPADIIVLMKVWEQTASTSKSVENWIWFYDQEFNKIINNLSKIIEPIMIVVVGWIVAFIALSVFGIIWNILDSVQTM